MSFFKVAAMVLKKEKKTRQRAGNKQTFDFAGKIEIERKTRQNTENKQTFDLNGKIEIERKTRQNAEYKQTFGIFQIIVKISFLHPHVLDFHIPVKK